jgi:hypothetical protein
MKTLSTPITNEKDASQSSWAEVYDIYLKAAITTPFGSTSVLRLTTCPGGQSFFTPQFEPEPSGTQGDPATYSFWPLKRQALKNDSRSTNDKLTFAASNVTSEWADMLADVDWYDTPVVIRKVSLSIAVPTADDCAPLFTGLIDSVRVNSRQITFSCSNDLARLATIAPRENMHGNCRFNWADDQCTAIRFRTENYDGKTCGASSTTTLVKSADLTEDAGSSASYGTDLVNALADGSITASAQDVGYVDEPVTGHHDENRISFNSAGKGIAENEPFTLTATVSMPSPLIASTTYYARYVNRYSGIPIDFKVAATPGGAPIDLTTNGSGVKLTSVNHEGFSVKSSNNGYWALPNNADWGTLSNGYWQIPDAQAGLANAALKPYLQFDFGSAKQPRVWRIKTVEASRLEDLARLLVLFSSSDAAAWTLESYFEAPPVGAILYTWLVPTAGSRRYWRLCVRSRWAVTFSPTMIAEVQAYENGRNWWAGGQITFGAATTTVALRNVVRRVLESYSGECVVQKLPVAPANGDTFVIERGCNRSFNACAERQNTENFGGFTTLADQTIIR